MKIHRLLFLQTLLCFTFLYNGFILSQDKMVDITLSKSWQTPDQLKTCESVCFDPKQNILYVSCINGNPVDKDGNGFIAKLSLSGEILKINWISGLNAPKGMSIVGSKLYVTDIDRIIEIDIPKESISKVFKVDGAKFLNDISADPEGNLFISDMSTGKIHRIHDGIAETWLADNEINAPNGMFYHNKEMLIGTKKGIYSVRLTDKRVWPLVKVEGGIDGLKFDGHGNILISDWAGKIQLIDEENNLTVLLNTTEEGINAADFEFIPEKNMIFVPTFSDNRVMAYELKYQ
jgi:hypothetical protein